MVIKVKFKAQQQGKELFCHLHMFEVGALWINFILMEWLYVAKLDSNIFSSPLHAILIGHKFKDCWCRYIKKRMIDQTLLQGYLN